MQYGFLLDHTRCIGCHACTVACKSENDVPVGDFRTYVKYTERGTFPAVKRTFAVLRCNQCTSAPCVSICPVTALSKRKDGIVDIDRDACIGCRACMQACPYDAIYLNEDRGAVEKCHFCAHRVEQNLAPACAVVCPVEAIVHGDLHDPTSKIARMIAEGGTLVRRPEQNTGPNVHYKGVEPLALQPGEPVRLDTYLWSERPKNKPEPWPTDVPTVADARTVLDNGPKVQWGAGVSAYLVTKGIAAGVGLLAPLAGAAGLTGFSRDYLPELLALAFTGLTTFLLVEDLTRPMKFLTLLTRPNTRSWLVRGAWILIGYTIVSVLALGARFLGFGGVADAARIVQAVLALGVSGYTAFLFAQCEGRDLWQSKLVLPHLLVQALALGAACLLPAFAFGGAATAVLPVALAVGVLGSVGIGLYEAYGASHPTANATQAAGFLRGQRPYGVSSMALSSALLLLAVPLAFAGGAGLLAAPLVIAGIGVFELAFVRAGQLPPLS